MGRLYSKKNYYYYYYESDKKRGRKRRAHTYVHNTSWLKDFRPSVDPRFIDVGRFVMGEFLVLLFFQPIIYLL